MGGSEKVGYDTAVYLRKWGVESHFITCMTSEYARTCLSEHNLPYHLLAVKDARQLGCPANLESILDYCRSLDLQLLIMMAWDATEAIALRRLSNIKLLLWHHMNPLGDIAEKLHRARARARRCVFSWLEYQLIARPKYSWFRLKRQAMLRRYHDAITCSNHYAVLCPQYVENLRKQLPLNTEEAERIISMINTYPAKPVNLDNKQKVIIYMGRLDRGQKQVDQLLRVWQRAQTQLDGWALHIYGSGKDKDYLKDYAQKLGLERCHFMGCVQHPEEVYRFASVLCLTSGFEGFPLALIEAQSHAVVPIAYNCCAGVEYIIGEDNKAGVLVPLYDVKRFADELVALCGDELRLGALRQACLDKCLDYAPDVNDANWHRILELES